MKDLRATNQNERAPNGSLSAKPHLSITDATCSYPFPHGLRFFIVTFFPIFHNFINDDAIKERKYHIMCKWNSERRIEKWNIFSSAMYKWDKFIIIIMLYK